MAPFNGFPEGKTHLTPLPSAFFTELLNEVKRLATLKVILYTIWRLDMMEGPFRCLQRQDFLDDERFLAGLDPSEGAGQAVLDEALAEAVRCGALLIAEAGAQSYYFLNSPKGRAAVEAFARGQWRPGSDPQMPLEWIAAAPNIYRLYEENFGPVTPLIADALRDAESSYPAAWIQEAIRIAVENNKRSWRYVSAILNRWQVEGRHERQDRQDSEKDRRRYVEGEFSDFVEH